ncbi:MAG: hypothetical protein IPJ88_01035 [Myxococcales bacterium]|nr:MAG: hypothetical protein IPJ88_01035 [Myxococcales bacterium]
MKKRSNLISENSEEELKRILRKVIRRIRVCFASDLKNDQVPLSPYTVFESEKQGLRYHQQKRPARWRWAYDSLLEADPCWKKDLDDFVVQMRRNSSVRNEIKSADEDHVKRALAYACIRLHADGSEIEIGKLTEAFRSFFIDGQETHRLYIPVRGVEMHQEKLRGRLGPWRLIRPTESQRVQIANAFTQESPFDNYQSTAWQSLLWFQKDLYLKSTNMAVAGVHRDTDQTIPMLRVLFGANTVFVGPVTEVVGLSWTACAMGGIDISSGRMQIFGSSDRSKSFLTTNEYLRPASDLFSSYQKHESTQLQRAVKRLQTACSRKDAGDWLSDLCTALDTLFLEKNEQGSAKVKRRASRLLDRGEKAKSVEGQFRQLYKLRNEKVHEDVDHGADVRAQLREFSELVRRSIAAFINLSRVKKIDNENIEIIELALLGDLTCEKLLDRVQKQAVVRERPNL